MSFRWGAVASSIQKLEPSVNIVLYSTYPMKVCYSSGYFIEILLKWIHISTFGVKTIILVWYRILALFLALSLVLPSIIFCLQFMLYCSSFIGTLNLAIICFWDVEHSNIAQLAPGTKSQIFQNIGNMKHNFLISHLFFWFAFGFSSRMSQTTIL